VAAYDFDIALKVREAGLEVVKVEKCIVPV
jgi:hypothetical protein